MKRLLYICSAVLGFVGILLPHPAFAHEVYVLSRETIAHDLSIVSPNPFLAVAQHELQFFLWGFICITAVSTALLVSLTRSIETAIDPFLLRIKKYAPVMARVTIGVCFIACAHFQALFGPELPFTDFAGAFSSFLPPLFYVLGVCFIFGIFARVASLVALALFAASVWHYGIYMLTYLNYFGEMLVVALIGAGGYSLDAWRGVGRGVAAFASRIEPFAFFIVRACFGVAVLYASFYAKFLHSQLALDTVVQYHLTNYFHFEPLFVVLGAFIIEALIGIFFIVGFELRFTALFFLVFLTLSLLYFGEVIWPHLVLIGLNLTIILHGYDRYTAGAFLGRKTHLEPVL